MPVPLETHQPALPAGLRYPSRWRALLAALGMGSVCVGVIATVLTTGGASGKAPLFLILAATGLHVVWRVLRGLPHMADGTVRLLWDAPQRTLVMADRKRVTRTFPAEHVQLESTPSPNGRGVTITLRHNDEVLASLTLKPAESEKRLARLRAMGLRDA